MPELISEEFHLMGSRRTKKLLDMPAYNNIRNPQNVLNDY